MVCLFPTDLEDVGRTDIHVSSVMGFPTGKHTITTKISGTVACAEADTDELNIVVNLRSIAEGYYNYISREVRNVVRQFLRKSSWKLLLKRLYSI